MLADVSKNGSIGITGVGAYVPERVMTNGELSSLVDTSDEWITERTGIKERHIAAPDQAASDLALPAARQALEDAGVDPAELDLVVVATVTPDMFFPSTGSLLASELGAEDAAAYDLSAGCTGFMYALAQAYGTVAGGLVENALVVGTETLSKIINWHDRSTCVLFGDGAGAVVLGRVAEGGFRGFELGSDGEGGKELSIPAGGSRNPSTAETVAQEMHFLQMNGREVYKFATRVLVASAEKLLGEVGLTVEEIDLYVPHQANKRIIDHAASKLGIPEEKVFVNVDRYGNTSSASIPLCLAQGVREGRLGAGTRVLMTGMGAGLTWGSAYTVWGNGSA
ncbi:MAG TPA: beta-ketoacyl-ACP synthase III [Gaiellaceae bacterium]|nr:beta-ketoacyl-ACP synthase III [Gaiellaceae bacterium]